MKTFNKSIVARTRFFLFLGALFLLAAMSYPAQNKDRTTTRRERIQITVVSVKPDMTADFENLIKNELNPGIAKGGAKWNDVWRSTVFGSSFEYIFVGPIEDYAQFDGASPLLKGLGKESVAAFFTKVGKMITSSRSMAYDVRDDMSYYTKTTVPPKMAVVTCTGVAPGRSGEYESYIKNEVLPVVQKSGIAGFWVSKAAFGGDAEEYITVVPQDSFAELEKGSPTARVLGPEGAAKLEQKLPAGIVARQERFVSRYVPELSYRPLSTDGK